METNNFHKDPADMGQLEKYAKDLTKVYKSEKKKRKELEIAQKQLKMYADDLKKTILEVRARNEELREAYLDTIHRLVLAAEFKDEDTGAHITRMSRYSTMIAEKLGLPGREVQNIFYATPMHDIGKIGIPDGLLMKPGKLTNKEFEVMKNHTTIGGKILENSRAEILQVARQIALSHHEKWNGDGYPQGLSRNKIPIAGRIVGLADTFDALTSRRPYKDPYPVEVARDIVRKERGEHFDPEMVDVFLEHFDEILKIKSEAVSAEDVSPSDFKLSERDQVKK